MFKKILWMAGGLVLVSTAIVWAADGATTMMPEGAPQITMVSPSGATTMDAYRWPKFQGGSNDNVACANWLKNKLSLTPRLPRVGYPNQPVITTNPSAFGAIGGLNTVVAVAEEYRGTATVMINWTVRVEGEATAINPWTGKGGWCHPWHGTIDESFVGGLVSTQLFVDEKPLGLPANMTLPDGGIVTSENKTDPTISGSYVIKPSDFAGNVFPATFKVTIKWQNDTCMKIVSPNGFRSMVITMVPQGYDAQGNQ